MRELINDPFYEMIKEYDDLVIEYCLIEDDIPNQGYRSHKDAVLFALLKAIERNIDEQLKSEVMKKSMMNRTHGVWISQKLRHTGSMRNLCSMYLRYFAQTVSARDSTTVHGPIPAKANRSRTGTPSGSPLLRRNTDLMNSARSIPLCSLRELMNLRYMSGRQTGRVILTPVMNGGAPHAGASTISA